MADSEQSLLESAPVVALMGWLVPGAGYLLVGERARGVVTGVTILILFALGLLIGGIRVIDVPGYDRHGKPVRMSSGFRVTSDDRRYNENMSRAIFSGAVLQEVVAKPWFVGQILTGPTCIVAAAISNHVAGAGVPTTKARLNEIGTLYTAVAGMLNLLCVIDASYRAAKRAEERA